MVLSNKQWEVLDFIKRFIATNGYSPTIREIMSGLSLKSPSTIQGHLKKLVAEGIITSDKFKSRTIELLVQNEYLQKSDASKSLPVLGRVRDKVFKEYVEVPIYMLNDYDPKNLYVYRDKTSMYIINRSLALKDRPSVVIKDDSYIVQMEPKEEIFGNIVSEFKIY